jgi:hypothetical protein
MQFLPQIMADMILGMGEVGETLYELLLERNFSCIGKDIDLKKCKNFSANEKILDIECLHICLPGEIKDFVEISLKQINEIENIEFVLIHSTVRPGTTKMIQEKSKIPIIYSPVRGVHKRFLEDIKKYTKFFGTDEKNLDKKILKMINERFEKVEWMSSFKTAELAKILVDTSYYGWLINYAQITKMICDKEGIDFDEMWKFSDEIHSNLGNRPKMYPGIIGGHCVIPNLNLIKYSDLEIIRKVNEMFKESKK